MTRRRVQLTKQRQATRKAAQSDDTASADRARKASRRAALVTQAARRFLVRMEEQ